MSKMYMLNRMSYAPAAGGPIGGLLKGAASLIGGLFKKKTVQTVVQTAGKLAKNPMVQTGLIVGGTELASGLMAGGGGGSRGGGASGGWGRRRRGITATELRGYRKVANLIHKEGMVSKRARGRH